MLFQDHWHDYVGGEIVQAKHPDLYAGLVRYPLDAEAGELDELIGRACAGDGAVAEWREKFIGDDGVEGAVRLLENLVAKPAKETSRSVTIEGATATAVGQGG
jgi:hypothetical protein